MGHISQEDGALGWGTGGTGEDDGCPLVSDGCHRERRKLIPWQFGGGQGTSGVNFMKADFSPT